MRIPQLHTAQRGLTLIEILVGIALIAVIVSLAAPSFKRLIAVQRLKSVNAQLVTDLQFARAEAASRNVLTAVEFDRTGSELTCYVVLTGDRSLCDCKGTPGTSVCTGSEQVELRTVQVPRSLGLTVGIAEGQVPYAIRFMPATGRIETNSVDTWTPPPGPFIIEVSNPEVGTLRNSIEATGRPSTCSPGGSVSGYQPC